MSAKEDAIIMRIRLKNREIARIKAQIASVLEKTRLENKTVAERVTLLRERQKNAQELERQRLLLKSKERELEEERKLLAIEEAAIIAMEEKQVARAKEEAEARAKETDELYGGIRLVPKLGTYEERVYNAFKKRDPYFNLSPREGFYTIDFNDLSTIVAAKKDIAASIFNTKERIQRRRDRLDYFLRTGRVEYFLKNNRKEFNNILLRNMEAAFDVNYDLRYGNWRYLLKRRLSTQRLIFVDTVGEGQRGIHFKVDILNNLKRELGTAEDYGKAVTSAKMELNYGRDTTISGKEATRLWYNFLWLPGRGMVSYIKQKEVAKTFTLKPIVGKSGKPGVIPVRHSQKKFVYNAPRQKSDRLAYEAIMDARQKAFGEKLPYWYLLNYGAVPLSSDRGGSAAPPIFPTMFVEKSEQEIRDFCMSSFNPEKQLAEEQAIKDSLAIQLRILTDLEEILSELNTLIAQFLDYTPAAKVIVKSVSKRFKKILKDINSDTLLLSKIGSVIEKLANQILAGETPQEQIYLYSAGGRRRRIRTRALVAEIRKEFAEKLFSKSLGNAVERAAVAADKLDKDLEKYGAQLMKRNLDKIHAKKGKITLEDAQKKLDEVKERIRRRRAMNFDLKGNLE